jgi:predicted methyltransferase
MRETREKRIVCFVWSVGGLKVSLLGCLDFPNAPIVEKKQKTITNKFMGKVIIKKENGVEIKRSEDFECERCYGDGYYVVDFQDPLDYDGHGQEERKCECQL